MFPQQQKENKDIVDVSTRSLQNLIRELGALGSIVEVSEDIEDIKGITTEAIKEIIHNISLLPEGVEYLSDEYSFIFDALRECE